MSETVAGYCPMGCGKTLFLGSGGYITCSLLGCPNPTAVADLLEDRETEHLVIFSDDGVTFTTKHPLRERLDDALLGCPVHERLVALRHPPAQPGTYRVELAPSRPPLRKGDTAGSHILHFTRVSA